MMTDKKIPYEVKLPMSLTIILGLIAFGLVLSLVKPAFTINKAIAAETISAMEVRQIVQDWCRVSKRSLRIYCDKKR